MNRTAASGLPTAMPRQMFAVGPNEGRRRKEFAIVAVVRLIVGSTAVVCGGVLVSLTWAPFPSPAFVFLGLILLGPYVIIEGLRMLRTPVTTLELSDDGMALLNSSGVVRALNWQRPGFRVRVQDYRHVSGALGQIPCTLEVGLRHRGISAEACDALVSEAKRQGLKVSHRNAVRLHGIVSWTITTRRPT